MRSISEINGELEVAEKLVAALREERNAALIAACPHRVGTEVTVGNVQYRIVRVTAVPKRSEVWLECKYMTSAGKWSQGTRMVNHKVED